MGLEGIVSKRMDAPYIAAAWKAEKLCKIICVARLCSRLFLNQTSLVGFRLGNLSFLFFSAPRTEWLPPETHSSERHTEGEM